MAHAAESTGIRIEGLRRYFGSVRAVDGVDLHVHPGEIIGLLGPNGAGKTTALRILSTLLSRDAGVVSIAGFDPAVAPLDVRRRVGYLTGDTGLYERITPVEQLRYFGELFGVPEAQLEPRVEQLIELLGIGGFASRRCGTLSTGQRQRVSIARSLVHDPEVLIFDEPTSGLDVLAAQFVLQTLLDERARGKAILFCSHVMAEAELICDRVAFIHRGRILARGTTVELLARAAATNLTGALLHVIGEHDEQARASMVTLPSAASASSAEGHE